MASTRSTRTPSSGTQPAIAQTPSQAVTAVAREGARMQLAAFSAAGKWLAGWAQATDRLAHSVCDDLLRRVDGETDSRELIVAVATAMGVHLRDVAALPGAAATHFDARVSRAPINN